MSARVFRTADLARAAGIAHFVASFGMTLAAVLALRANLRSSPRAPSTFAVLYATTAVLALATFFLSIFRAPRDEIRARFRTFR